MRGRFAILGFVLILAGCVRTSVIEIDDRRAWISGRGTGFDSYSGVMGAALREAAEVTKKHGMDLFMIVNTENGSYTTFINTPAQSYTNGNVAVSGNTATYSEQTTSYPGRTIPIQIPRGGIGIRMYKRGEIDPHNDNVYDADIVLEVTN